MKYRLKSLADQVIVITGASSGIGLVTARAAAQRGAAVMLIARSGDTLAEVVRGIEATGGRAAYAIADVGDLEEVRAAAAVAIERFGRIDTWVNNAGVAIYAKLMNTPSDEHERLFRTNYFGTVHGCQAAVPLLEQQGGALITVGSIASDISSPIMGAYSATKHAVAAYVDALRMELKAAGTPIAVTLIKPSGIDTPIARHAADHAEGGARIPPPVYDPALVADAILHAAVRPTRNLTVGGAGRVQELAAALAPALFDRIAPLAATSFLDPAKRQPTPSNLFEGDIRAGDERSGEQSGRRFSIYTTLRRHRLPVMLAVAALASGSALAARTRR